mmetsp:Transcript_4455/g.11176  ORF Transcript_4455/g.11176 Transcript_4455/m.11176 type:complete len:342 (-) Transcript_4455:1196-2221(-)
MRAHCHPAAQEYAQASGPRTARAYRAQRTRHSLRGSHDAPVPGAQEGQEGDSPPEALLGHGSEVEHALHALEHVLLQEDHVVLLEPQPRELTVNPRQNVGDPVLVALAVRRALATPVEEISNSQRALPLGLEQLGRGLERGGLVGDHRERVRKGHEVARAGLGELLRDHGRVAEVAEDALHNVRQPSSLHTRLGDLEEGERHVNNNDLLEVIADGLHREELEVAGGAPPNVEPDHLATALGLPDGDALGEHGTGEEHLLAERIVLVLLVLVEGLHLGAVLVELLVLVRDGLPREGLHHGERDDLDARLDQVEGRRRLGGDRRPAGGAQVVADGAVHLGCPG